MNVTKQGKYSRVPHNSTSVSIALEERLQPVLNLERRYEEAERHCRSAIRIDPRRHNAHKNLGIALQGLERHAAAAKSFLRAAQLCPADGRALGHLEELLAAHGEVLEQNPGIRAQLHDCHEAVQSTKGTLRPQ